MKTTETTAIFLLAALAVAAALALFLVSCAGSWPWLKPQGELVQLAKQAAAAKRLATAPRTLAALDDCIRSAQDGVHAIEVLRQAQEKLRAAKKQGVAIPELERGVIRATADAENAETQARADCWRAGVRLTGSATVSDEGVDAGADARLEPGPSRAATPTAAPGITDMPRVLVPDGGAR